MLEIGYLVDGKYKVLNKIGQGGMSVVYLAMNEKANKQWAIKEVRKDGVKDFETVKQGLIVETNLLKKLNHPNLPSIVDVIDEEDTFLIVMDYIQGNPLSKALEEYGAQPQDLVIEWAKQLCEVLGYLHSRKPPIIYRDMKPANIMLKPDGTITLIDFGIAREYKEKKIADTTCLGTIGYAAPEQFGDQGQTDPRTDIYCLGATLYHLVTGHNPSEPPYEMVPIRQINPSLSSGLEKIIFKCTQRNPEDRYQSCAELMYALNHYDEIDDKYRSQQTLRFGIFATTFLFSILFLLISIFGYRAAENKKFENYDIKLALARDGQNTQKESIDYYLEAIEIEQSDTRAYLELLELFLADEAENGSFSREEAKVITQLQAGIDTTLTQEKGETIYPLLQLKAENRKGYAEVCYEIGMAYWYDYEIELDRYNFAQEWFRECVEEYPIAQIYCDIGEIQLQINKYTRQKRTEKIYEAYQDLWVKMEELKAESSKMEDSDVKYMVWTEIVGMVSSKAGYFAVNITPDKLRAAMEEIQTEANELRASTKYDDIKRMLDDLLQQIEDAKLRIESI